MEPPTAIMAPARANSVAHRRDKVPERPVANVAGMGAAHVTRGNGDAADTPSASTVRKLMLLVCLMRLGRMPMQRFLERFEVSERSFKRDLKHVRELALEAGFVISPIRDGVVTMTMQSGGLAVQIDKGRRDVEQLLDTLARVLGEPVGRRLKGVRGEGGADAGPLTRRFLHFAFPELVGDSWVADVYDALEKIWSKNAYARFMYPKHDQPRGVERLVEPHAVVARAGRYYLIAYGREVKGWRYFALDQMLSKPQAGGKILKPRPLPEYIRLDDSIGMIIGDAKTKRVAVTVELAPRVARSVVSRRWQHDQEAVMDDDGSGAIVLHVPDVDEVVRWTFGFGGAARVVAPPEAVARAKQMLEAMAGGYRADQ
ncbi:WYL domain-containing transcriptional regulator [bacterium]|nr:MAG: WYL domain-containing transcriptional regulator [bacterium]